MGALGYSISRPSLTNIAVSTDGCPYEIGMVAAMRNGEVLGSQTVLKSDHCPGCQNLSLHERVDGAPNFRQVPGFPVYGVANPTVDGIRVVIQQIRSKGGYSVFWHNMREEPVIYINGKPFVLREVERPYKNMLEYTVIYCSIYATYKNMLDKGNLLLYICCNFTHFKVICLYQIEWKCLWI